MVREWLMYTMKRPKRMTNVEYRKFVRYAKQFFINSKGRLYRQGKGSQHKLVVEKEH